MSCIFDTQQFSLLNRKDATAHWIPSSYESFQNSQTFVNLECFTAPHSVFDAWKVFL